MKILDFKIIDVNVRRMQRGAEGVKIGVYEDGQIIDCLWMSKKDMILNARLHGECEAFSIGVTCVNLRKDLRKETK